MRLTKIKERHRVQYGDFSDKTHSVPKFLISRLEHKIIKENKVMQKQTKIVTQRDKKCIQKWIDQCNKLGFIRNCIIKDYRYGE